MLKPPLAVFLTIALALTLAPCGCKSTKPNDDAADVEPLDILRNVETRYVAASELGKTIVRSRIGWINIVSRNNTSIKGYEFVPGNYRFREGLFTPSVESAKSVKSAYPSMESLAMGLHPYVQGMPVGFVLTLDGKLPNADDSDPPDYFKNFVRDFQTAMALERIKYALIVPVHWKVE